MNMHSLANARQAIGYMEKSGANLSQSLKRLSSGIKVDGASDAGGLAVSSKMDSVITRTRTLGANVQNGMSFLESQDAAQSKLGAILTRMSELRVRYDDPTINTSDGANFNREFKELQDDVRTLAQKKFNGISLFSSGSDADSKLVIGANSANPSNVREVTRNQFFNSLLETQSSGGPIGAATTTQATFGSFTDLPITPTGGTAAVPLGKVNGLQGATTVSTLTPTGGTASVPLDKVNGLQGTTSPAPTIQSLRGTTPALVSISAIGGPGGGGTSFNLTPAFGNAPEALWTENYTGGTNSFDKMSPVFDNNGDIFIGLNNDNEILKLNAADGATLQTYDLRDALTGDGRNQSWKVAVTSDTVYAANGNGKQLIAFDKTSGAQKAGWPQTLGGAGDAWAITEAPPFVHSNGNVYVMSNGEAFFGASGKVYCFQPDGNPPAGFTPLDVNGEFTGGFAEAADGTLIVTGKGAGPFHRSVQAFHPNTGASLWTKDHGFGAGRFGRVSGPPAILGTSVVVNTNRNTTRAYDVATGNQVWRFNQGGGHGGPAVGTVAGTATVFVASASGVRALQDDGSGSGNFDDVWRFAGVNAETCTPIYDSAKNRVYVTDDVTGNVFALRTVVEGANAAGTEAWRHATGDPSLSSPAIDSNGNVYVGDNNGDFTAISTWEAPVADGIGSGFATAPALADIVLDPTATNKGTLQVASVTLNAGPTPAAGTLRITFTGKASSSANIGVTVAGGGGGGPIPTPPAEGPVGSGYQTGETPTARVLADGIGDIIADITNPFSGPLSTGLAALIDGNANPAGGPVSNAGSGPDGTFDAAVQEPVHESADRRSGAGAFTFDGTDDKINLGTLDTQIGQNAATGAKNELTISAWVYHTDTGDDRIVCKSPDTNVANHIFSLGISTGDKVRMRIGTVTTPATTMDGGSIPLNEWTHVAMTYDGANVKSYVNGSLDSTHALTGNIKSSTTDDVYIGNVDNANNRHFKGSLDDIGIWNQALDASQIAEIAGPGNLTATTSVNDGSDLLKPAGTLTVTPVGTPAKAGKFFVEVDDGFSYFNNENNIGSGYATGETPAFTISGGGSSMTGNATVDPATGKLNIDLSSARPADATDRTLTVVSGTIRAPADLTGIGSGYTPGDTPPTVSISGGNKGTLAATATINDGISGGPPVPAAGTLNITFTAGTSPTDTNDVSLKIYDGVGRLSNLSGVGGNYASGETPAFTISGGGTSLLGTATVNDGISGGPPPPAAGTLNLDLSTVRTNDLTDRTLTIGSGAVRAPANLTGIGSGYTPGAPPPTVLISGANKGTLAATTTINDGISGGPPPPAAGTLNINFTAGTSPTDTNDVTIQIDDGVGHLANLSGVGSGYGTGETPAFTISGGGTNMTGTATVDPTTGKLNVDLSNARPDDLVGRTLQIANGALQTPAPVTGIGAFHDPASPPTATISGADVGGVTVNTINVNSSGSVDVTFAGVPSGTGPLTVTVAGGSGTGGSAVSSKYLLDIDGDLWDYSVAEFESFTELVSDARAQNGAEQNSLGTFWDLLSTNVNKLEQAAGRIKDADFAKEMTELSKSQIINRSAAVMHGKQNRITSEALLTLQNLNNML